MFDQTWLPMRYPKEFEDKQKIEKKVLKELKEYGFRFELEIMLSVDSVHSLPIICLLK